VRMRTIPYAAGTAVAAIGATLLLSGSASAAPAGDDRGPVPPGATFTVCSVDGSEVTAPRITKREGVEPRGDWRPAQPATPREPEVHCEDADGPAGTCAVVVPARPAEPGGDFAPALPAEPGTRLERADGPTHTVELTCEGADVLQTVPRR